jgi:hypothetical protein
MTEGGGGNLRLRSSMTEGETLWLRSSMIGGYS